jgi:glutamate 5-kinase
LFENYKRYHYFLHHKKEDLGTEKKQVVAGIAEFYKPEELPGIKVILVSSGAVGMGMNILKLKNRPSKLSDIQALAAIGQSRLMSVYEDECRKYGFHAAQLLLTADGLKQRERHLNALNCIHSLWSMDALPVINENDSISVDELKFGDNDILAALISVMVRADFTLILTTSDGIYSGGREKPEFESFTGQQTQGNNEE